MRHLAYVVVGVAASFLLQRFLDSVANIAAFFRNFGVETSFAIAVPVALITAYVSGWIIVGAIKSGVKERARDQVKALLRLPLTRTPD